MISFNLNSNQHLSLLLFGGSIKEKVKQPVFDSNGKVILIKSGVNKGQIKIQSVEQKTSVSGLGLKPLKEWATKKEGVYQTNEQVLQTIVNLFRDDEEAIDTGIVSKEGIEVKNLCKLILKMRGLNKDIQTYYDGILDKIYPDGRIRASYNHTGTSTGRLSSNNPNLQNCPK